MAYTAITFASLFLQDIAQYISFTSNGSFKCQVNLDAEHIFLKKKRRVLDHRRRRFHFINDCHDTSFV